MLSKEELKKETENVVSWVKEYVTKSGAKGVIVGNSGGKDSAVVIAIATKALGAKNVITVAMPCSSTASDLEDAKLVAKTFNVSMLEVNLEKTYSDLENEINVQLQKLQIADTIVKESKINMKPRLRMTTLYAIAQTLNYLVVGTGNLSEKTVGYTTKWGDSACDFAPISNFTVEEVLEIGKNLGVPENIIKKAPNDGLGGQTDEEKMGILYSQISEYIETGKTDEEAMKKIQILYKKSEHKRNPIPTYKPKKFKD